MNYNKIKFENTKCLICKSSDNLVKILTASDKLTNLPGVFYLKKCLKCGLVFQDPRPKEEYIKYFYPDNLGYYGIHKNTNRSSIRKNLEKYILVNYFGYTNLGKKNLIIKTFLFPLYIYRFKWQSIPSYVENGALLEIGCSTGVRLEKLKNHGWDTKGMELNKKAAKYAIEKRGLNVDIGSIFDFNYNEESFDVIILDMVLEHLYDSDKAMLLIKKWLKKDGQLIFSIPYFEGVEFKIFKEHSYGLQLPTHLTFFNKNTLSKLLAGFSSIKYSFHNTERDICASAKYKYNDTNKKIYKLLGSNIWLRILIIKPFVFFLSLIGKTSRVNVSCKKI